MPVKKKAVAKKKVTKKAPAVKELGIVMDLKRQVLNLQLINDDLEDALEEMTAKKNKYKKKCKKAGLWNKPRKVKRRKTKWVETGLVPLDRLLA